MTFHLRSLFLYFGWTYLLTTLSFAQALDPTLDKLGFHYIPALKVTEVLPNAKEVTVRVGKESYIIRQSKPFFLEDDCLVKNLENPKPEGDNDWCYQSAYVHFSRPRRYAFWMESTTNCRLTSGSSSASFFDGDKEVWNESGGPDPIIFLKMIEPSGTVAYCIGRNGTLQSLVLRDATGKTYFEADGVMNKMLSENGKYLAYMTERRGPVTIHLVSTDDPKDHKTFPAPAEFDWISGDGRRLLTGSSNYKLKNDQWWGISNEGKILFTYEAANVPDQGWLSIEGSPGQTGVGTKPFFIGAVKNDSILLFYDKARGKVVYLGAEDGKTILEVPIPKDMDPLWVVEGRAYEDGDMIALGSFLKSPNKEKTIAGRSAVLLNLKSEKLWELQETVEKPVTGQESDRLLDEFDGKVVFHFHTERRFSYVVK